MGLLVFLTIVVQGVTGNFLYVDYFVNQNEAEYVCEQYNMVLPKISSDADNTALMDYVLKAADRNDFSVWLGLRHNRSSSLDPSKFKWVDGTSPSYMKLDSSVTPDTVFTQYCFRIDLTSGFWYSSPCIQTYRFVCFEKVGLTPDPASAPTSRPAVVPTRHVWGVHGYRDTTGSASSTFRKWTSVPKGEVLQSSLVSGLTYIEDCLSICLKEPLCIYVIVLDTTKQCMPHKQ